MLRKRILAGLALATLCFAIAWAADYVMKPGDTLYDLAKDHYGDPGYWRALKWYNGVGNVYTIPVGTPINFPDKAQLDRVNEILKQNLPPAQTSSAIAALGGATNPVPPKNAGLGRPISYAAVEALGRRQVPSR